MNNIRPGSGTRVAPLTRYQAARQAHERVQYAAQRYIPNGAGKHRGNPPAYTGFEAGVL